MPGFEWISEPQKYGCFSGMDKELDNHPTEEHAKIREKECITLTFEIILEVRMQNAKPENMHKQQEIKSTKYKSNSNSFPATTPNPIASAGLPTGFAFQKLNSCFD